MPAHQRPPLRKRYPGEHVARLKIWTPAGDSVSFDGAIYPELSRLIVALLATKRNPDALAIIDSIATELQGVNPSESPNSSDRALREKLTKARAAGKLGRK